MTLNYEEFKDFIVNSSESNFKNASYDLRIGKIIDMDGNTHSSFKIPSQSMVVIVSQEEVKLNNSTLGYATVKTALSQKGLMANNIGIIDALYEGSLSSVLTNFGKDSYRIKTGENFLRLTFHKFTPPKVQKALNFEVPYNGDNYLDDRIGEVKDYLGEDFFNLKNIVSRTKKEVIKFYSRISIIVITAIGLVSLYQFFDKKAIVEEYANEIKDIKNQIHSYAQSQNEFNTLNSQNSSRVETLSKQIDSLEQVIKTLKGPLKKVEDGN
ncbi:MAG: hypothetical protein RIE86_25745 [Imperialibacter sp.]|uniref:hypothetical protein n=1 Tax=Imperialibacter sp. TaxID=2038411 RepID=UPI0032ED818D